MLSVLELVLKIKENVLNLLLNQANVDVREETRLFVVKI